MGPPPDHPPLDRPPPGPLSPARTALLAASLLGLLAVVSLATRADGHGRAVPGDDVAAVAGHHALVWLLLVAAPIAGVVGLALLMYGQVVRRRDDTVMEALRRRSRRRFALLALIVTALVLYREWTGRNPLSFLHVQNPFSQIHGGASGGHHVRASGPHDAIGGVDWAIAAVTWLVIVAVLAVVIRRLRRRRPAPAAADEVDGGMAEDIPDLDLEGLRSEPDARRAVIGAYALMERVMARRELGRERSEAPLEYLGRMTATGFARIAALGRLTRLYARARFSTHPINPAMKAEAVDAVAAIAAGEDGV